MTIKKGSLFLIGAYLFIDGLISIGHFPDATQTETFFRVIRAFIGAYLVYRT